MSAPRRWSAAAVLIGLGWLLTPQPVTVYDGVGAPDEPYRYVSAPAGARTTAAPTSGSGSSPLAGGTNSEGMSIQSSEQSPQVSLFVPQKGLAAAGSRLVVTASPLAPTDQPPGATIDGNVYDLAVTAAGPVTLTPQAAIATLYMRATTAKQPGPVMEHRSAATGPWKQLQTSRGGQDSYVSSFVGPGQYALAFVRTRAGKGVSVLPYVLVGGLALLVVVVLIVRLRASESSKQ